MATKKSGAAAKKTTKKTSSTARKTTTTKVTTTRAAATSKASVARKLDDNIVNIMLAELVGTFVLASVALMTASDVLPLFIGLTLAALVMVIGGVSGSHVNPAVTFGLWSARKLKSILVPFYWGAQFVGAMAALLLSNAIAGTKVSLDFGHFATFAWPIFFVELVGTAVFLFILTGVLNRSDLTSGNKALGIGLALFIGLAVSTSFDTTTRQAAIANYTKDATAAQTTGKTPEIPHEIYVSGATLNPAIALVSTESTKSQLGASQSSDGEIHYSRISWEVIFSTLIGAALGANLALLVARRFRG